MAAQRVRHGVHHAQPGVGEGHAGDVFRVGHHLPGLQILPVPHGPGQIPGHRPDRPVGVVVGIGIRSPGAGRLDGVGQGVEPGRGRQLRRHGDHKIDVVDGDGHHAVWVDHRHFGSPGRIGDNIEGRAFGAGARGRVDDRHRQPRLCGLVHPFVVLDPAAVGHDDAGRLRGVDGAAAADGDQQLGPAVPRLPDAPVHDLHRRIGLHPGKHLAGDSAPLQHGAHPLRRAGPRQKSVRHDECPPRAQLSGLRAQVPDGAPPEKAGFDRVDPEAREFPGLFPLRRPAPGGQHPPDDFLNLRLRDARIPLLSFPHASRLLSVRFHG